jgi:hypothetical protein
MLYSSSQKVTDHLPFLDADFAGSQNAEFEEYWWLFPIPMLEIR